MFQLFLQFEIGFKVNGVKTPMYNLKQKQMIRQNIENGDTTMYSICLLKLSYIVTRMKKIENAYDK